MLSLHSSHFTDALPENHKPIVIGTKISLPSKNRSPTTTSHISAAEKLQGEEAFSNKSMDPQPIVVAIPEIVDDEEGIDETNEIAMAIDIYDEATEPEYSDSYDSAEDSLYKPYPREDNDEDDTNSEGGAEVSMRAATKHGTEATAETATEVATAKKGRVKTTPLKGHRRKGKRPRRELFDSDDDMTNDGGGVVGHICC
ncbi:hypothetical protein RIF29_39410 [Crotalaria pallida]|uniref:Uncharacterized protein n=1 Tax=Crotalaria pallida TaxID=3830 RepID=A0AAN9E2U1_CROPI